MLDAFIPRWNKHVLDSAGSIWTSYHPNFLRMPKVFDKARLELQRLLSSCSSQVFQVLTPSSTDGFFVKALYVAIIFTLETSVCRVILFNLGIDFSSFTFLLIASSPRICLQTTFLPLLSFTFLLDDLLEFIALA